MAKTTKTPAPVKPAATKGASTQDKGTVHVGGGMMRFASTKDTGTVHVGGGMMRF